MRPALDGSRPAPASPAALVPGVEAPYAEVRLVGQAPTVPRWHLDLGAGNVVALGGSAGRYQASPLAGPRQANFVLRMALAAELAARGGVVLHAAGVVVSGKAYLFLGRSGAGKTTISMKAPGELLSDDTVVVVPRNDRLEAWGTPFVSDNGKAGVMTSAPIGAIAVLAWGELHAEPMASSRLLRALYEGVFLPPDRELLSAVSPTVLALAEQVPGYELVFPEDYRFHHEDLPGAR